MTLRQLRYLREVVRSRFNISRAAEPLCTSQPAVSKQVRLLEAELGVPLFVRNRDRIVDLSPLGRNVVAVRSACSRTPITLKEVAKEFASVASGDLIIATTHTQARYALRELLKCFAVRYPEVRVQLRQGSTSQIAQFVVSGDIVSGPPRQRSRSFNLATGL